MPTTPDQPDPADPRDLSLDEILARNTSEKSDEGQKFANKLWNAFRFALGNLENLDSEPRRIDAHELGLADQWILNQLNKTIQNANGVDLSLIRSNLQISVEERIRRADAVRHTMQEIRQHVRKEQGGHA